MVKVLEKMETKIEQKVIAAKLKMMSKLDGDGHYVAIAVSLLLALTIGALVYAFVSGSSGMSHWLDTVGKKIDDFFTEITTH